MNFLELRRHWRTAQGLGLLAIPGLGSVVAAGWLTATAVGAAAGAATATGGIIGALTEAGVSEEDAHTYVEGVRRGGALVTARVPDTDRAKFDAMLDQSSVNIRDRRAMWQKSGRQRFDPQSKPYGLEEVRRERELWSLKLNAARYMRAASFGDRLTEQVTEQVR